MFPISPTSTRSLASHSVSSRAHAPQFGMRGFKAISGTLLALTLVGCGGDDKSTNTGKTTTSSSSSSYPRSTPSTPRSTEVRVGDFFFPELHGGARNQAELDSLNAKRRALGLPPINPGGQTPRIQLQREQPLILPTGILQESFEGELMGANKTLTGMDPALFTQALNKQARAEQKTQLEELYKTANTPALQDQHQALLHDYVKPSVVRVEYGTGVIIHPNGILATTHHGSNQKGFVEPKLRVNVTLLDGRKVQARVLGANIPNDIAFYQLPVHELGLKEGEELPSLSLVQTKPERSGTRILSVGFPVGGNTGIDGWSTVSGQLSNIKRQNAKKQPVLQFDKPVPRGYSGGPGVNGVGDIEGIFVRGNTGGYGYMAPANRVYYLAMSYANPKPVPQFEFLLQPNGGKDPFILPPLKIERSIRK